MYLLWGQGNIQRLTVQQLDKYKADAWLLSPPCQPYTRQGRGIMADFCTSCDASQEGTKMSMKRGKGTFNTASLALQACRRM